MKNSSQFQTPIAKARGLGSAGDGSGHWWLQRITAIALVPLCIWFVTCFLANSLHTSPDALAKWLSYPLPAIGTFLLCVTVFYHAKQGMQVVIEDYVSCNKSRVALLMANSFITIIGGVLSAFAVLKLHFINVVSFM